MIANNEQSTARSLLVPIQTGGSKWPFFCIARENFLAVLARYLGPEQPVYGLIPFFWDVPRASFTLEQIAADFLEEIRALQPEGPYFLGGYSFGGLVAFEMAHQLQTQGQEVRLLVLIDAAYPSRIERSLKYYFDRVCYCLERGRFDILIDFLALRVKRQFPFMLPLEDIRQELITTRIITAMEAYKFRAYSNQIIFFESAELPSNVDKSLWANIAIGGLEIYQISGDHCTMLQEPHVQILAERLKACLDRAPSGK